MSVTAIIAAGGKGTRIAAPVAKQFLEIEGKPILFYTLKIFEQHNLIDRIVVVVPSASIKFVQQEIIARFQIGKISAVVTGGLSRQESIWKGLEKTSPETTLVAVHDAVRPFVSPLQISRVIGKAREFGAAIIAVPVKETIKLVDGEEITSTPDRSRMWLAQTPQVFRREILMNAYRRAFEDHFSGTDDASLVERMGHPVHIVEGSYWNIKITTPEDLELARLIFEQRLHEE